MNSETSTSYCGNQKETFKTNNISKNASLERAAGKRRQGQTVRATSLLPLRRVITMPLNVQPDAVKREASRLFREDGIVVEPTHHKENTEKEDSCRTSEGKSVWNTLSCPCRTLLGAAGQGAAPKRDAHVLPPRTRERKRVRKGRHQRDRVKGVERKGARSSDRLGHVCPHRREQRGRRRGRVQTG